MRTVGSATIHTEDRKKRPYLKNDVENKDQTIPLRLVGTNEYLNAIENFRKLIQISVPTEMEVYDKVLATQDEFSYQSGATIASLNNHRSSSARSRRDASTTFKKHSLAWMLALARIEIGATVSMYGDVTSPFAYVARDNFGQREYYSLLRDDVAAHLTALQSDPILAKKAKRNSETDGETIAYLRRLKVVNDMLTAIISYDDGNVDASTVDYLTEIERYRKKMQKKIKALPKLLGLVPEYKKSNIEGKYVLEPGTVRSLSPLVSGCQKAFLTRVNNQRLSPNREYPKNTENASELVEPGR